jgi:hypothetical protein
LPCAISIIRSEASRNPRSQDKGLAGLIDKVSLAEGLPKALLDGSEQKSDDQQQVCDRCGNEIAFSDIHRSPLHAQPQLFSAL